MANLSVFDTFQGSMALLFAADDKFGDVIAALEERGWRRLPYVGVPKFDLKWTNYSKVAWTRVKPQQIVNHFQNAILFSRKDLFTALLYAQAAGTEQGQTLVDGCFPRTFDLGRDGDQCLLKKWFQYSHAVGVLRNSVSDKPTVDEVQLMAAIELVNVTLADTRSLECWRVGAIGTAASVDKHLDDSGHLASTSASVIKSLESATRGQVDEILKRLEQCDPQFHTIDGAGSNVWICKPSNLSQGRGIVLCSSLHELAEITSDQDGQDYIEKNKLQEPPLATKWIVQKYIERPLLLQNGRKFDIRQWVLLTELEPEPIAFWFYKSYLRFCSRPFELSRLHDRFMHLSNYSVQQHFVPDDTLHAEPGSTAFTSESAGNDSFEPMWSSEQFQELLCQMHNRDVWLETIMPQMQNAARLALHAVLPKLEVVGRGFEWLGFDFLVDENYRVWLLEVNVSPDVSHSTSVTAELAPKATVDALNLVLDPENLRSPANGWLSFPLK